MRRRDFIKGIAGSAVAWPLTGRAQQPAMPVIGFLHSDSPEPIASRVAAFRKGLGETGYVEGQNVAIQFRWAAGQDNRLPDLSSSQSSAVERWLLRRSWRAPSRRQHL